MTGVTWLPLQIQLTGVDQPSDGDNAQGTDDTYTDQFLATLSASDSPVVTEAGSLLFSGPDTGTGTDTGSLAFSGSDTGTGTDTGTSVITSTDNPATITEFGSIAGVAYIGVDAGTGVEEIADVLNPNNILAYGVIRNKWLANDLDVSTKWGGFVTNRWIARLVTSGDQIS